MNINGQKLLAKTSNTRFANSKRFVLINVLRSIRVVVKCLQDIQNEGRNCKAREREKASDAAALEGRLLNATCVLELCAAADIYNKYGHLVNICQQVNILPHERVAKFDTILDEMDAMKDSCEEHDQCAESCKWPFFHKSCESYISSGEILGIPITEEMPCRAGVGAHTTRSRDQTATQDFTKDDIVSDIKGKAAELVNDLAEGLRSKVFLAEERAEIAFCETLTNLEAIYLSIHEHGPDRAAAILWPPYLRAIRHLVHTLNDIDDKVLHEQFDSFCHVLTSAEITGVVKNVSEKPLSKREESISSEIMKELMSSKSKLYVPCKLILHSLCRGALRYGVESVVESMISSYEHRFPQTRNVLDGTASEEMEISVNGPSFNHCKDIASSALTSYFSKGKKSQSWHFLRSGTLFGGPSQTLSCLRAKMSKFPFLWKYQLILIHWGQNSMAAIL